MADAFKAEIEDLKKKLSQNPDSLTFVPLAEAYRKSGMYKEAMDACKAGLEKHPAYTSARVVLGRLYLEQELYDEAAEELKKVEAVDHDNIMVHSMLGNIYVKKQMFAQAVEQFQRVLSLNPEDMETQDKLQEALSAKQTTHSESKKEEKPAPPPPAAKEEKPAMTELQKSLKVAELYSKKEEFDKAIEIYRELLEKDAENIIIQQRLREVYDLQQKKINKQKEQSEKRKSAENDKITAEDILDVMKEAVENDLVDEEKTEPPVKKEEPKKEVKKEEPKKEEVKKEEPKKDLSKTEVAKSEAAPARNIEVQVKEFRIKNGQSIFVEESYEKGSSLRSLRVYTRRAKLDVSIALETDKVSNILLEDLTGDGLEDLVLITESAAEGGFKDVYAFVPQEKGPLAVVPLFSWDNSTLPSDYKYKGNDQFNVENGLLVRTLPGLAPLKYRLQLKENGFQFTQEQK